MQNRRMEVEKKNQIYEEKYSTRHIISPYLLDGTDKPSSSRKKRKCNYGFERAQQISHPVPN